MSLVALSGLLFHPGPAMPAPAEGSKGQKPAGEIENDIAPGES